MQAAQPIGTKGESIPVFQLYFLDIVNLDDLYSNTTMEVLHTEGNSL